MGLLILPAGSPAIFNDRDPAMIFAVSFLNLYFQTPQMFTTAGPDKEALIRQLYRCNQHQIKIAAATVSALLNKDH